jgi:hypothetical protein
MVYKFMDLDQLNRFAQGLWIEPSAQLQAYCRHLLQGESVEEHGVMLHNNDDGAVARGQSDANAVHGGTGKQAAEPVNFIPTSHLVRDSVHHAKTEQVTSRSLLGYQLTTLELCLDLDI